MATYFSLLVQSKVGKRKHTPTSPLFFALLKFSSRKISKLASLKQTNFPKNFKSLRRLRRGPRFKLSVNKSAVIFVLFMQSTLFAVFVFPPPAACADVFVCFDRAGTRFTADAWVALFV